MAAIKLSHPLTGFAKHTGPPSCRGNTVDLTHEGKSESLLSCNKSVKVRSEFTNTLAVMVQNLTQLPTPIMLF